MKPLKTVKIYPKEKKHKYFSKWYLFIKEKEIMNKKEKEIFRLKVLLDYNDYLKKCISQNTEINKNTIKDYLKGSSYHQPIKIKNDKQSM
tara:strand:- start:2279 stop:2548 length:270 start_codon:yes stop_codon:yes gene_type:complete